jgi:general secretion pathway protein A
MYESFFGLREPAFSLKTDPRFLWVSETHGEALSALCYGIRTRKGFMLLTGGVGTGKTTLLRAALEKLLEAGDAVFITNTAGLGDLDLLKLIANELGCGDRLRNVSDCVIQLRALVLARARVGRRMILVIDEAQNLKPGSLEQLRLLSNLESHRESPVQIVLTGHPELRRMLSRPALRALSQRIVIDHHLEPLRPHDVPSYLEHRIQVAGGAYDDVFAPGVEPTFFGFSAGCPRLLSVLADRALLSAYARGVRPAPRALVEAKAKEIEATRVNELWEADIWDR